MDSINKKIVFLIYSLNSGGAERVISILSNFLINKYEITILMYDDSKIFYEIDPRVNIIKIDAKTSNIRVINLFSRLLGFYKKLKESSQDVLISFTTTMNLYSIVLNLFLKKKLIISERNHPLLNLESLFEIEIRNLLYKFSDKIVVQNKSQLKYYNSRVNNKKISIIHNPIVLKKHFNSATNKLSLINIGRLEIQKNHIDLVKIFQKFNENLNLEIYGEGSLEYKLKEKVKEKNLENRILFKGLKKNINKYLEPYSIFVSTSLYEGFPNALIEAMNNKMACIHYNCEGINEIIQDGINGYLVPVGDKNLFLKKLIELTKDVELRIRIGESAYKSIKHLDVEEISKQWVNLIEN